MKKIRSYKYEVSETGRIYSIDSNWRGYGKRELKQSLNSDGYPSVRLTINGKRKRYTVHSLVCKKYHRKFNGAQVRHLDGDKLNCHKNNLKWGTAYENAVDREAHGRTSRGKNDSLKIKKAIYAKK